MVLISTGQCSAPCPAQTPAAASSRPPPMQSLAALSHPLPLFIGISVCESDVRVILEPSLLKGSNWSKATGRSSSRTEALSPLLTRPHGLCYPRAPNPGP